MLSGRSMYYFICISSSKIKTLAARIFERANRICGKGVQDLQVKEYRVFYRSGHCRLVPVNLSTWTVINDMKYVGGTVDKESRVKL